MALHKKLLKGLLPGIQLAEASGSPFLVKALDIATGKEDVEEAKLLAAADESQKKEQQEAGITRRRKSLALRGRRSTVKTRISPDIFASSLGAPKVLLGS